MSKKRSADEQSSHSTATKTLRTEDGEIQEATDSVSRRASEQFLSAIVNGHTMQRIYDTLMDTIITDPVLLDAYQQMDFINVIFAGEPDFPFPNILWLVKKRHRDTQHRLKEKLKGLETFFIIHLSVLEHRGEAFISVEVSYLDEVNSRINIILGCFRFYNETHVVEGIERLINFYGIEERCYHVCSLSDGIQHIANNVKKRLTKRNNFLSEYLSKNGKLNEDDLIDLKSLLQMCQGLVQAIEKESEREELPNSQLNNLSQLISVVESDQRSLEVRMGEIRREPEQLRYYSWSGTDLGLLCASELRKLTADVRDIKANLGILLNTLQKPDKSQPNGLIGESVTIKADEVTSVVHWRKVLDSCLELYIGDFWNFCSWANAHSKMHLTTSLGLLFQEFVDRITPKTEFRLWTLVFLTKQWLKVLPNTDINYENPSTSQELTFSA